MAVDAQTFTGKSTYHIIISGVPSFFVAGVEAIPHSFQVKGHLRQRLDQ
jgi:hypothetical protein